MIFTGTAEDRHEQMLLAELDSAPRRERLSVSAPALEQEIPSNQAWRPTQLQLFKAWRMEQLGG